MIESKTLLLNKDRYLITPSLLNSWAYIWLCGENVREAQSDEVCIEDKILVAQEKAYNDFITVLNRIKTEPNEFMLRGIEYEDECYKGNTDCSPIIEGGAYQIVGKKEETIDDIDFLLYGRLDVLKGGIIYDIKRVSKYSTQKYLKSYQHPFYFELFKECDEFDYLIYDGDTLHIETYYRDQVVDIKSVISQFIKWLKKNNLLELYKEKWRSK